MPGQVSDFLNLDLALTRVIKDVTKGRTFFNHTVELEIVESDRMGWLGSLRNELQTYVPGDLYLCNVPKPHGSIRPGGILSIRDQTVYTAAVGAVSDPIRVALEWPGERVDFSYPISPNATDSNWFGKNFLLWRHFGEDSLARLNDWAAYVILSDITAYYETIDLGLLASDLRSIGAAPQILELLSRCLNKWSQAAVSGRGLPQGFSASDILARFYLNGVDRGLRSRGVHHLRYVDDIRIFCRTESEAKRHLVELILLLRKRGLSVQTAKTEIVTADVARDRIEGLMPALRSVLRHFVDSVAELFSISDPYFSLMDAEAMLANDPNAAPIVLIRQAYEQFLIQPGTDRFDKTLFHFLLRRLGKASDDFAIAHVIGLLRSEPQETREILRYLSDVRTPASFDNAILDYLESADAVYSHQIYEILFWRVSAEQPPERFLAFVRNVLYERRSPPYLRSTCREFLASFGAASDLERLQDDLLVASDDLERAELLCCLRRMEAQRRNTILGRYSGAGPNTDRAINITRRLG